MSAIKNLFLAEANLTHQIITRASEAHEAAKHDGNAQKWLKPNTFGTINQDASRDSRRKAAEIRQHSADSLASRKRELLDQLREVGIVAADFQKLHERRVAITLSTAAQAVGARHFTDAEFPPTGADKSLASKPLPE